MATLSRLTLTSYRRTQPNRDPIEEQRSKTFAALELQKHVLTAVLRGQNDFLKNLVLWARFSNPLIRFK